MIKTAILFFLIFSASKLMAQTTVPDSTSLPLPTSFTPSLLSIGIKLVLALGLIIGLIYISTYFLKKLNARSIGSTSMTDAINIMGRTYLSPKQCLYIIRIGSRYIVVGATDSGISNLGELSPADAEKYEKKTIKSCEAQSTTKFSDILRGIIKT